VVCTYHDIKDEVQIENIVAMYGAMGNLEKYPFDKTILDLRKNINVINIIYL
jgi:hypothetical protein